MSDAETPKADCLLQLQLRIGDATRARAPRIRSWPEEESEFDLVLHERFWRPRWLYDRGVAEGAIKPH